MKHICGTCKWYKVGKRIGKWPTWGMCTYDGNSWWARYTAEEDQWLMRGDTCQWERASDEEIAERALGL